MRLLTRAGERTSKRILGSAELSRSCFSHLAVGKVR